ncbi:hypothetical protein JCM5350_000140 [Sporobolomyces pararoseus]
MAGSSGLSISHPTSFKSRWVGRSAILPGHTAPKWVGLLALTSSFFGLQLVWSCEMAQASPFLLSLGVSKSMMAVVFVAGPLSGLLAQPLVGVLSDSCKSKFGRRRPFIFGGVVVSSLSVMLLGWAKEVASWFAQEGGDAHRRLAIGFAILAVYLVDFSVNVVQAMDRALLVDVVPPADQASANAWAARMFGFGAVFGYGLGTLDLVRWSGGFVGDEQIKVIAFFTIVLVCVTHAVTLTCVQERILLSTGDEDEPHKRGNPLTRAVTEVWHAIRTIPRPIQSVFNVQFFSWISWFPILFYTTTWIAEIYVQNLRPISYSELADAPTSVQEDATRAGTTAMFYHSVVALVASILVPPLIAPTYPLPSSSSSRITNHPYGSTSSSNDLVSRLKHYFPIPISWLTLPLMWTISTGILGTLLLVCSVVKSVEAATVVIALIGFNWACTNWIPFAVLADLILRLESPGSSKESSVVRPLPISGGGAQSIMLHSARSSRSRKANPSTSTANVHTLGSASEDDDDGFSTDSESGRTIDLDRTPRPVSTFVSQPTPSPFNLKNQGSPNTSSSNDSYQDLPPTPATGTSVFSTTSTAYFDLPSPSASPSLSTPPLPSSQPHQSSPRRSNSSAATLSPVSSPQQERIRGKNKKKKNRYSIASSAASFDYPPNNGGGDFSSFSQSEEAGGSPRSIGSSRSNSSREFQPDLRASEEKGIGLDTFGYGYGRGDAGASTSTIKLPYEADSRDPWENDEGDQSRKTIRIRHSDELSSLSGGGRDKRSFEFSASEDETRSGVPKIRVGDGSDEGSESEDDRWLREEHDVGGAGNSHQTGGGGDQAGVILGCHNIYLVLPQFLVTALSSIIFAILDPGKSVLGAHAPTSSTSEANATVADNLKRFVAGSVELLISRTEEDAASDGGKSQNGYSALSLIFQIGGISALVSMVICFRFWRASVKDNRRLLRTRTGYGRVNG